MNNVNYDSKQNWQLNEIVNPADVNKWEKGIADVAALANYLNSTDVPNLEQLLNTLQSTTANKDLSNLSESAGQKLIPVGALMMGPVPTMEGFLLCNGQAVSRTRYSALYALLGTSFGSGDGSTTFNVPDYRGCFLRGLGGNSAADMYTKQPQGLPNITGKIRKENRFIYSDKDNSATTSSGALQAADYETGSQGCKEYGSGAGQRSFVLNAALSNSIYGAANEVRPVNFAINYFIKY